MTRPLHKKSVSTPLADSSAKKDNAVSEALFACIGEGAIVTDRHGHISKINQVALKILGYSEREIIGAWYPDVIVAEDSKGNVVSNLDRPITEVFIVGKPIFKKHFYRRKDGSRVPVALTVSPVVLNNRPFGAIEVFRDISEEVELDNSKDEFISIASHQLRTPATIVKQYLGMILEGYSGKLSNAQTEMLRIAYENNELQIETINDLLKVAQADANQLTIVREKTDIAKLLGEVVREQRHKYAKKKLGLELLTDKRSVAALVDPLHLRMVFDNLLDNAYKYSHENKSVTVKLFVKSGLAIIKIKDQGVGIDKKDMSKLFQKFTRISNPLSYVGGTGLGLYWAQKLVYLHNGKLTATSKPEIGTTFTVKIPLK